MTSLVFWAGPQVKDDHHPHFPHVVETDVLPNIIFGGSAQKYDWE